MSSLGTKNHSAGNKTRYVVDYSNWLDEGCSLASGSAVLSDDTPAPDVVIEDVVVTPSGHLVFFVTATTINEAFTIEVQVVDSRGEIKNNSCSFCVTAP